MCVVFHIIALWVGRVTKAKVLLVVVEIFTHGYFLGNMMEGQIWRLWRKLEQHEYILHEFIQLYFRFTWNICIFLNIFNKFSNFSSDLLLTSRPIKIMTEMRDRGTIGFIGGPEDTCISEALVAAAWNLPMISYVRFTEFFQLCWSQLF